jgi:hypothetical protein
MKTIRNCAEIRRERETRVKEYEERMQQLQFDMRRQL